MACEDWAKIISKSKSQKPIEEPHSFDARQSLFDCLQPEEGLAPFRPQATRDAADKMVRREISAYASKGSVSKIAQPTLEENGRIVPNEFFMRQDRLHASLIEDTFIKMLMREAAPA